MVRRWCRRCVRAPRVVVAVIVSIAAVLCLAGGALLRQGGGDGPVPRLLVTGAPLIPPVVDDASGQTFLPLSDTRGYLHVVVAATASGQIVRSLPITGDDYPTALAVDARSGHAFLALSACLDPTCARTAGTVRMLDARSGRLVRSVPVGPDARALAVDSAAGRVYAGAALAGCPGSCPGTDGVLTALDAPAPRIQRVLAPYVAGLTLLSMALDGQAKRLVIAGSSYNGPGRINLLDTASGRLLHTVPLATGVWDAPVIVPATKRAFVAVGTDSSTGTTGALDVLGTTTGRLVRTVPLPGGMVHLAVDEPARRVFVTTFGPAYRAVFTLSGGGGIAEMRPTGTGRLLIFDARSGALVRSIPTGWGTTAASS